MYVVAHYTIAAIRRIFSFSVWFFSAERQKRENKYITLAQVFALPVPLVEKPSTYNDTPK